MAIGDRYRVEPLPQLRHRGAVVGDGHTPGDPYRLLEERVDVARRDEADGGFRATDLIHAATENCCLGYGLILDGPGGLYAGGHHLVA